MLRTPTSFLLAFCSSCPPPPIFHPNFFAVTSERLKEPAPCLWPQLGGLISRRSLNLSVCAQKYFVNPPSCENLTRASPSFAMQQVICYFVQTPILSFKAHHGLQERIFSVGIWQKGVGTLTAINRHVTRVTK